MNCTCSCHMRTDPWGLCEQCCNGVNEGIVPPIEQQHDAAKKIALQHGFEPNTLSFPRCVGAIMQAWRKG